MGEISEMIFEGILCQLCGVVLHDSKGEFPQSCENCSDEDLPKKKKKKK